MRDNFPRSFAALACVLASAWSTAQTPAPAPDAKAAQDASASKRLRPGDVAPPFAVVNPDGETVRLADFAGKIVIVDVSATWCGPCQAAMPNNDRVYRKYADQGVALLGITADDARKNYDGWLERNAKKYEFTMYFDPAGKKGWDDSVFNTGYHVTGFPAMFVIGRDGKLVETIHGGGPGIDYRLEYALARAGAKVDLASLPPEPKRESGRPVAIPMMAKTKAMPAKTMPMIGMGGGGRGTGLVPAKFGGMARGAVVPDCTFEGTDGEPMQLSSLRGKCALVHFNTSNGPQPWLTEVATTYRDQDVATLVVFAASEREDFATWVEQHPAPGFEVAWDPAGKAWAENVTNTVFGVGMFPVTVVLDSDGKLVSGVIGMGDRVALSVKAMLAAAGVELTEADRKTVAAGAPPIPRKPPRLGAGTAAPDFVSSDVAGNNVRLADLSDKIVVLDFWATWCGPCKASMPHTQAIAREYADQDVVVLAVCTGDTRENFDKWVAANSADYPQIVFTLDPHERGSKSYAQRASAKLYHVGGIPTKFVIGKDGVILASLVGYQKGDVRTEAVLAKAGVEVDPAVVSAGQAQLAKDAEKAKGAAR